jgi:hypothetical protein
VVLEFFHVEEGICHGIPRRLLTSDKATIQ